MSKNAKEQIYGGPRFIALWTVLIMLGLALEFVGRFFGYVDGSPAVLRSSLPIFTGALAVVIILSGYFIITGERVKKDTLRKRTGVLFIVQGAFMLIGFFAFKQVMPLIFG